MKSQPSALFYLFTVLFLMSLFQDGFGQSRETFERRKRENRKKLEETNRILRETQQKKQSSLGQLRAMKQKIKQQRELVQTLQAEVDAVKSQLNRIDGIVTSLENDIQRLKTEYGEMIYQTNKISYYDKMMFVFSSRSINDMLLRLKYLENYSEVRKEQIEAINEVKKELLVQEEALRKAREKKAAVLAEQNKEKEELENTINSQNSLVQKLSRQEGRLRREVKRRKKANQRLEELIKEQLRKEADASREVRTDLDASGQELSNLFKKNKRKLNWPVGSGFISSHYGKQPHPVLKNITIENLGIDIQTSKGQSIKAVYQGKVSMISNIPGKGYVVFVQHGQYYTVYSNLSSTSVKVGDAVNAGDAVGKVRTSDEGTSEMQFQIWRNNKHLDPEDWLKKK